MISSHCEPKNTVSPIVDTTLTLAGHSLVVLELYRSYIILMFGSDFNLV